MDNETLDMTQKELLIRIDERQKLMLEEVNNLKNDIRGYVRNDNDYKETRKKIKDMWDMRNKMIGYSVAMGAIGSIAFQLVLQYFPRP